MEVSSTSIAFWLNWKVLLCLTCLMTTLSMALYAIKKYTGAVFQHELWRSCWRGIHPTCLLRYRMAALFAVLFILVADVVVLGWQVFYFYTEWTYVLLILYFGIGSYLSAYGCYRGGGDDELPNQLAGYLGYMFQIIYQILAGAIVLANIEFWCMNARHVFKSDNSMAHMESVILHLINFPLFLGDVTLNGLRFPLFRIAYFAIWTCVYIFFQWFIHVFISMWWPSGFLRLSTPLAPLWYFLMMLLHVPCYGVVFLVTKAKYFLSREQ